MKRIMAVVLGVLGAAAAGCSTSGGAKSAGQAVAESAATAAVQRTAEGMRASDQVTMRATVVAIDHDKRLVTLRGPEGNEETFKIGPQARNLSQVRKGDEVVATYYEAVAVKLRKPGEATPGVTTAQDVVRAAAGEMPGGAWVRP
jgi:hypothetical protein